VGKSGARAHRDLDADLGFSCGLQVFGDGLEFAGLPGMVSTSSASRMPLRSGLQARGIQQLVGLG
jgi:hypothetical protein